jgi:hypothetical protein
MDIFTYVESLGMGRAGVEQVKKILRNSAKAHTKESLIQEALSEGEGMDAIFTRTNLAGAFEEMERTGAAIVKKALRPKFRKGLHEEVAYGPFTLARSENGVAQQFTRFAFLDRAEGMPLLERLRQATEELVRAHGYVRWRARDVVAQHYVIGDHLGAHRDLKRHPLVLALFTLHGFCDFELLGDKRENPPERVLRPYAGDLVLLRGYERRCDGTDPRPFHRVETRGCNRRLAVAFRDNDSPEKEVPGFGYLNFPERRE